MKSERGTVTVELALAVPAVLALAALLVSLAAAGLAQVRCADAARSGARQAALGADDSAIDQLAEQLAGPGLRVTVTRSGGQATVVVVKPLSVAGLSLNASARATTQCEPDRCG